MSDLTLDQAQKLVQEYKSIIRILEEKTKDFKLLVENEKNTKETFEELESFNSSILQKFTSLSAIIHDLHEKFNVKIKELVSTGEEIDNNLLDISEQLKDELDKFSERLQFNLEHILKDYKDNVNDFKNNVDNLDDLSKEKMNLVTNTIKNSFDELLRDIQQKINIVDNSITTAKTDIDKKVKNLDKKVEDIEKEVETKKNLLDTITKKFNTLAKKELKSISKYALFTSFVTGCLITTGIFYFFKPNFVEPKINVPTPKVNVVLKKTFKTPDITLNIQKNFSYLVQNGKHYIVIPKKYVISKFNDNNDFVIQVSPSNTVFQNY